MPRRLLPLLLTVATGVAFVALWYGVHFWLSEDSRFLLPAPDAVLRAFGEYRTDLVRATLNTVYGALLGFALAIGVSILAAVVLSLSPIVRISLYPYLMLLQMTPIIIAAPILILWVGPGLPSVVLITFLICFFPLAVNTTQGLVSTDRNLVDLFRMWRASRFQQLVLLRLPAALPYFFTGLRIAATLAPIGALVGDYTAGSSAGDGGGLGFQALIYSSQAKYAALFATAAVTCVLGFVFVGFVLGASRLALRHWHDSFDPADK
ncbi:ABC transporter permease [Opitutus terrae]|uniref:Binding-protein-dependent transport systems inner membrane component n=1 Tax=Opitutus terrae (strain DSM 11246 / JCM 15787 / PB90-1) TaxID=452637 RepID=B1ZW87_OPITP|nr:ABC transporter permease subunit [Opitutus terrae]ACB76839.1 binding-protein-dependent transport systems inner membrane component [Opitutus terrae PB90-1]